MTGSRSTFALVALPLIALLLVVGSCTAGDGRADGGSDDASATGVPIAVSSTIVGDGDGGLWLASPDDRSVVHLDVDDLVERRRVDLDAQPHHVLWTGGRLVVSGDGSSLSVLGSRGEPTQVSVECAATAGMTELGVDTLVAVACPIDDRVVVVDVATGRVVGSVRVPGRPESVAVADGELVVLATHGGRVWTAPLPPDEVLLGDGGAEADGDGGSTAGRALADLTPEPGRPWTPDGRDLSGLDALAVDGGRWVAAYQSIDNDTARDPADPADTGSYGTVEAGDARIQPMLTGACATSASDFTDPTSTVSGVHALAYDAANDRVWVVGQYSATVLVLDCARSGGADDGPDEPPSQRPPSQRPTVLAAFEASVGAAGITLSDDGRTAWVDLAFDHAVARLDLPEPDQAEARRSDGAGELREPTSVLTRAIGASSLSAEAMVGRRVFHDATDVHLTPSGVVTCASCHPGGGEDGRTWRIGTLDIAQKLRRTPALQGLRDGDMRFHADAEFDSLAELTTSTIRQLMSGDALLVDTSSVATYLSELRPEPPPFGLDSDAVARGRVLFESSELACASCHVGPSGSDGRSHRVDPRASDPDSLDGPVRTPRLVGLAGRAPYLHDGSAAGLEDLLAHHPDADRSPASWLTERQLGDLVTYLRSR